MSNSRAVREAVESVARDFGLEVRFEHGKKTSSAYVTIGGQEYRFTFHERSGDVRGIKNAARAFRRYVETKMQQAPKVADLFGDAPKQQAPEEKPTGELLVYHGAIIDARDEMLSLTSMWKAAGSDPSRRPAHWLASADARRFIDFLMDHMGLSTDVGNSYISLVRAEKGGGGSAEGGGGGGTWAHWQIGLAYAKYLEPEFHVWCNEVIRDHMERRQHSVVELADELPDKILQEITSKVTAAVSRNLRDSYVPALKAHTDDVVGRVSAKVTEHERLILERDRKIYGHINDVERRLVAEIAAALSKRGPKDKGTLLDLHDIYRLAELPEKVPQRGRLSMAVKRSIDNFCRGVHHMDKMTVHGKSVHLWTLDGAIAWLEAEGRQIIEAHLAKYPATSATLLAITGGKA